jgi:Lar family restriction alleviation protein
MSAPELKPCPFCGGEAYIYETSQDSDMQIQAQCKGCGAEIAFWLPWTAGAGQQASAWLDVEARWNRRTTTKSEALRCPEVRTLLASAQKIHDLSCGDGSPNEWESVTLELGAAMEDFVAAIDAVGAALEVVIAKAEGGE